MAPIRNFCFVYDCQIYTEKELLTQTNLNGSILFTSFNWLTFFSKIRRKTAITNKTNSVNARLFCVVMKSWNIVYDFFSVVCFLFYFRLFSTQLCTVLCVLMKNHIQATLCMCAYLRLYVTRICDANVFVFSLRTRCACIRASKYFNTTAQSNNNITQMRTKTVASKFSTWVHRAGCMRLGSSLRKTKLSFSRIVCVFVLFNKFIDYRRGEYLWMIRSHY